MAKLKQPSADLEQKTRTGVFPKKKTKIHCNLCNKEFLARNKFIRFCDMCRSRSEVYRFNEVSSF